MNHGKKGLEKVELEIDGTIGPAIELHTEPTPTGEPRKRFLTFFISGLFGFTTAATIALVFLKVFTELVVPNEILYPLIGATITQIGVVVGVIVTQTFKEKA